MGTELIAELFGDAQPAIERYARILENEGIERGLLGPREGERVWQRHILNSLAIEPLLARRGARVIDVGSGAGLPGIPLAIARPDLNVVLLDSLARRVEFLQFAVSELGLPNVAVARSRAEDYPKSDSYLGPFDYVVCRAVASLGKLLKWCMPLLNPDGTLVALKGETANDEVKAGRALLNQMRLHADVRQIATPGLPDRTWVIRVSRETPPLGDLP